MTGVRVLIHNSDEGVERALRERGLELVGDLDADALVTFGPPPQLRSLADIPPDVWRARFNAWTQEPFWRFQAWLRELLRRDGLGRWVAVTSTLGVTPLPGGGADGTAAMALQTLVRVAAIEYGDRGLRANVIAPGWRVDQSPAALDRDLAVSDTPTRRLSTADDVAAAVAWLLSGDADQLNGEIIRLDGGYTITRGSRSDPTKR
ncbi:MAG: SDR family oxidoreductase [Solirubrobacterales bacterium]|nr:SDR family oxidoreductase [Solirubrobacterales bacterium]